MDSGPSRSTNLNPMGHLGKGQGNPEVCHMEMQTEGSRPSVQRAGSQSGENLDHRLRGFQTERGQAHAEPLVNEKLPVEGGDVRSPMGTYRARADL